MDWEKEIRQAVKLGAILISITGILTFSGVWVAHLKNEGQFEQWQSLGKPPETAVRVSIHEDKQVSVETIDGDIHVCPQTFVDASENCWTESEHSMLESEFAESSPCYSEIRSFTPKSPGKIINMVEFHTCEYGPAFGWTNVQYNFALLDDGSVWVWEHASSSLDSVLTFWYGVGDCILGVVISIIIMIIVDYRDSYQL